MSLLNHSTLLSIIKRFQWVEFWRKSKMWRKDLKREPRLDGWESWESGREVPATCTMQYKFSSTLDTNTNTNINTNTITNTNTGNLCTVNNTIQFVNGATQIILENHCNCKSTAVHPTIKVHWAVYTVASFSLSSNCVSQQSRAGEGKWKLNCSALQSTDLSCILQSALQAFISQCVERKESKSWEVWSWVWPT